MAAGKVLEQSDALKKPACAYWIWLGENRARITTIVGKGSVAEVAKKGGEMWKALSAAQKAPFDKKAKTQKDDYDKFIATDAGKAALEAKKAAKAEDKAEQTQKAEEKSGRVAAKEERQNARACKAAVKAVDKDEALKKPQPAYWIWLSDNRQRITTMLGNGKGSEVAKKGGEMWKALSDAAKAPYEKKSKEQKDAYDKYVASAEGVAKLKAFKDATQAAKDQFQPKEAPVAEAVVDVGKKRKATEATAGEADVPTEKGAEPAKKRGRPSKAQIAGAGA